MNQTLRNGDMKCCIYFRRLHLLMTGTITIKQYKDRWSEIDVLKNALTLSTDNNLTPPCTL